MTLSLHIRVRVMYGIYLFVVFIHFYSASHSMSISEALPTTAHCVGVYMPKCYRQL